MLWKCVKAWNRFLGLKKVFSCRDFFQADSRVFSQQYDVLGAYLTAVARLQKFSVDKSTIGAFQIFYEERAHNLEYFGVNP